MKHHNGMMWSYKADDTLHNKEEIYHRLVEEDETSIFTTPVGLAIPNAECVKIKETRDGVEIAFDNGRTENCEFQAIKPLGPELNRYEILDNIWIFRKCLQKP